MKRNRNSVIRASYKIRPGIHNRQVSVSWSGSWSTIQESLLQKDLLFIFACVCIIYAHLCGCSSVYVSVGARDWPQISFVVVLHFVYRGRVSHWSKLANLPQGSPISISWVLGLYWAPMPIRISCECWNPVSGPLIGSALGCLWNQGVSDTLSLKLHLLWKILCHGPFGCSLSVVCHLLLGLLVDVRNCFSLYPPGRSASTSYFSCLYLSVLLSK